MLDSRSLFVVGLFLASVPAQTFVVDRAGGAGSQFLEISAAVAAVPDGATLLVRPGVYQGFGFANKGLTILGDPGVRIDGIISVSDTAAHQSTILRGFDWVLYTAPANLGGSNALIQLTNCIGRVVLEDLDTSNGVNCLSLPIGSDCVWSPGLQAQDCHQLVVRDCRIHAGAQVIGTAVLIESSEFLGKSFQNNSAGDPTAGLTLAGSFAQVAGGSTFVGGDGVNGGLANAPAQPGIWVALGDLRFLEGHATGGGIAGGLGTSWPPKPAVELFNASLRRDPVVQLTTFGAPLVGGFGTVDNTPMPVTTSTGAAPGGTLTASVSSENGDLLLLVTGLPGNPTPLPGFRDAFWLDATVHVFSAIGVQQGGVPLTTAVPVPANPALRGLALTFQGVADGPVTGLAAANPSFAIVR